MIKSDNHNKRVAISFRTRRGIGGFVHWEYRLFLEHAHSTVPIITPIPNPTTCVGTPFTAEDISEAVVLCSLCRIPSTRRYHQYGHQGASGCPTERVLLQREAK